MLSKIILLLLVYKNFPCVLIKYADKISLYLDKTLTTIKKLQSATHAISCFVVKILHSITRYTR